jgi:diguanylate cyclase (GGDEF)-like protein
MLALLIPFLLGLLATAGLLVPLLLRFRSSAAEARQRALALEGEIGQLRLDRTRIEEDHRSLSQFLKEFPHLSRGLFSGLTERQVPSTILHVLQKSLDPAQAVVMVRKGQDAGAATFVVAAVAPEGGAPGIGTEVQCGRGEIGFVAETQLVVGRQDLAAKELRERIKPGPDSLPGLQPEFYAPLVFDQETLGLIALSRPRRRAGDGKAALQLISQTAAQALHAHAAYSRIQTSAEKDSLTGLLNKRRIEHLLSELIYRTACATYDLGSGAAAGGLSIFLFDIDHFKHYNDTNGHPPGDKLLQELARLVQDGIRKDDMLGRFGGEEFLLIMPNTNLGQALAAANNVRAAIAAHKFAFAEKQPLGMISVSGGVAEYPHDGKDAASLVGAADAALYEAKRQGRNRVQAASRSTPNGRPVAGPARVAGEPEPAPAAATVAPPEALPVVATPPPRAGGRPTSS